MSHITRRAIASNAESDVIWERFQAKFAPLRRQLNAALDNKWEEWEPPRDANEKWSADAKKPHAEWWEQRIDRQKEIDASIAGKADFEHLIANLGLSGRGIYYYVPSLLKHFQAHEINELSVPRAHPVDRHYPSSMLCADHGAGSHIQRRMNKIARTPSRISSITALPRPGECCLQKDHIRQVDIAIPIEVSHQAIFSEVLLRIGKALR